MTLRLHLFCLASCAPSTPDSLTQTRKLKCRLRLIHALFKINGVQAYGKTAYLITTFSQVPRGTEGAVSLEGTAAGIAAAALFSAFALALKLVSSKAAQHEQSMHLGGSCVNPELWLAGQFAGGGHCFRCSCGCKSV